MALRTGIDLVELDRLEAVIARQGERFLERVYTAEERTLCGGALPCLAARWAAKEAVAKALGTGIGEVRFTEIEILRDAAGAPVLHLHGQALRRAASLGLQEWAISLTHTQTTAAAVVVATG